MNNNALTHHSNELIDRDKLGLRTFIIKNKTKKSSKTSEGKVKNVATVTMAATPQDTIPQDTVSLATTHQNAIALKSESVLAEISAADFDNSPNSEAMMIQAIRMVDRAGATHDGFIPIQTFDNCTAFARQFRKEKGIMAQMVIANERASTGIMEFPQEQLILAAKYQNGEIKEEFLADYAKKITLNLSMSFTRFQMGDLDYNPAQAILAFRNNLKSLNLVYDNVNMAEDSATVLAKAHEFFYTEYKHNPRYDMFQGKSILKIGEDSFYELAKSIDMTTNQLAKLLAQKNYLHIPDSAKGYQAFCHVSTAEQEEIGLLKGVEPRTDWFYCIRKPSEKIRDSYILPAIERAKKEQSEAYAML